MWERDRVKKNHGKRDFMCRSFNYFYWNKVDLQIDGCFTAVENKLVPHAEVIDASHYNTSVYDWLDFFSNYWDSDLNAACNREHVQ